ncbi:hypothetical protein BGZ83_007841 [Gryganskiella cystojenkinii]|nr:hypothetical protein BGZ83_007841 [Gryganskiella cystojenkinii]
MAWRELMNSTKSDEVTRRWYPIWYPEENEASGFTDPFEPMDVLLNLGATSQGTLFSTSGESVNGIDSAGPAVQAGWYTVTICLSLMNLDLDSVSALSFLADRLDVNRVLISPPGGKTTFIGDSLEELRDIKDQEYFRLRLPNEVPLKEDESLYLTIDAVTSNETSFVIHYVEIDPRENEPQSKSDYKILYGLAAPDQIVNISQPRGNESGIAERRHVHNFGVSGSGNVVATLALAKGKAFLEVWDITSLPPKDIPSSENGESKELMSSSSTTTTNADPVQITSPDAQASFDFPALLTESFDNGSNVSVQVSYSGSKIVLLSSQHIENFSTPFMFFRYRPQAPKDHSLPRNSEPWPLEHVSHFCDSRHDLGNVYGEGTFIIADKVDLDERKERFIFSDGLSLSVYDTTSGERWTLMHRIQFISEYRAIEMSISLMTSFQGRYVVWSGYRGIASVWDIETGKSISHFGIDEDRMDVISKISADGSMVLVSSKGIISLYQTLSGIKLGIFEEGLSLNNYHSVRFDQNHFAVVDISDTTTDSFAYCYNVVSTADMSIQKKALAHSAYQFRQRGLLETQVLGYCQGSVTTLKRLKGTFELPVETICPENCELIESRFDPIYLNTDVDMESSSGEIFKLKGGAIITQGSSWFTLKVSSTGMSVDSPSSTDIGHRSPPSSFIIPVGPTGMFHWYSFHAPSSKLIVMARDYIQVWRLSAKDKKVGTLESIRKFIDDRNRENYQSETSVGVSSICTHGARIKVQIDRVRWLDLATGVVDRRNKDFSPTWVSIPKKENEEESEWKDGMPFSEAERIELGLSGLIAAYVGGDVSLRNAIVEFLKPQIRPTSEEGTSVIIKLVNLWSHADRGFFELVFVELLRLDIITWVPDFRGSSDQDPVRIMLEKAQIQPSARATTQWIIHYCVTHAIQSRNLAFLTPVFANMKAIMDLYPEKAIQQLARVAYLPVPVRDYILDHHLIAQPPTVELKFWNRSKRVVLNKSSDPIMQLELSKTSKQPVSATEAFTKGVFMASFDALWYYKDRCVHTTKTATTASAHLDKGREAEVDNSKILEDLVDKPAKKTNWFKTLFWMTESVMHLRNPDRVECYDFNLEYFDNPAIAALVAYKWNTIGYHYWMIRFLGQFAFYSLVVIAALMQVYYHDPSQLVGLFIAIIVLAAVFLWLEFLQALQNWSRYEGSLYNLLDMIAFLFPLAASAVQIHNIYSPGEDKDKNVQVISYSVLAVSLHLLFELRINKSVCKYVTIIQQAIVEIKVFFIVFACGILAFAIATLHLTNGCPTMTDCKQDFTVFPKNFFRAVAGTYFFMGGNYDPVGSEMGNKADWGVQVMIMVFFFFTVIVMMNVLIALVNVAFEKGGDSWRLIWIESRLRYIESAENMSYYIPGFRETYDVFPEVIYYTATEKQVKDYREKFYKYFADDAETRRTCQTDSSIFKGWARDTGEDDHVVVEKKAIEKRKEEPKKSTVKEETNISGDELWDADEEKESKEDGDDSEDDKEGEDEEGHDEGEGVDETSPSKGEETTETEKEKLRQEREHEAENKAMSVQLKTKVEDLKKQLTELEKVVHTQLMEIKELLLLQQSTRGAAILGE